MSHTDVIDELVGHHNALRDRRPITVTQTQLSYQALLETTEPGNFRLVERFAVALFVALLHQDAPGQDFYAAKLQQLNDPNVHAEIIRQTAQEAASQCPNGGPYGAYPPGPLSRENVEGPKWQVNIALAQQLGGKLKAAFEHAYMLIFHPRDANKIHLELLIESGWQTPEIVTLSQLVSFLTFQLRIAHGFRILAATPAH